ncbi:hypothetical protein ACP4OV_003728 [Aristida adscensionis]
MAPSRRRPSSISSPWLLLLASLCTVPALLRGGVAVDDPTAGFVKVDLAEGNFVVQSPYDVPENQRYSYDVGTGVRSFWVYADDKPFNTVTPTHPRTEVRLTCHDYSSGVWQFEAHGYVPAGTSGACVMQIHNEDGGAHATTLMLRVYNGALWFYDRQVVEDDVYDRWFRLNVVHDADASTVSVHVDGGAPRVSAMPVRRSVGPHFGSPKCLPYQSLDQ